MKIQAGLQLLRLREVADPALGHSVEAGSQAKKFQNTGELWDDGGVCLGNGLPHHGSSKGHWGPRERRGAGEVGCWGKDGRTLTCRANPYVVYLK